MGCVYRRGRKLWVKFKNANGEWAYNAAGCEVGQEDEAAAVLVEVERRVAEAVKRAERRAEEVASAAGTTDGGASTAAPTMATFADEWLADRKELGIRTWKDDRGRLKHHILPVFGRKRLGEIKVLDVRAFVHRLRRGKLAPKTVGNVYSTLRILFKDALLAEIVDSSPCILDKRDLGAMIDKDPAWRSQAIFTRCELEQLVSDDRIPTVRRVQYALLGTGGLRTGEAAGLRWGRWDPSAEPLGRLDIVTSYDTGRTKTGRPRSVPVHPTLAAILSEWKLAGWPEAFGRAPGPEDLIVPLVNRPRMPDGRMRDKNVVWKDFSKDLELLGLRHRRVHDLRRTFISLARADGARKDLLESCTHSQRGNIVDIYTEWPWAALCDEVAKLRIERRRPQVVEMRAVAAGGGGAEDGGVGGGSVAMVVDSGEGATPTHGMDGGPSRVTVGVTVPEIHKDFKGLIGWRRRESKTSDAGAVSRGLARSGAVQPPQQPPSAPVDPGSEENSPRFVRLVLSDNYFSHSRCLIDGCYPAPLAPQGS